MKEFAKFVTALAVVAVLIRYASSKVVEKALSNSDEAAAAFREQCESTRHPIVEYDWNANWAKANGLEGGAEPGPRAGKR